MKRLWWSAFFGALIGTTLLAPENKFSNRILDLIHTVQDSVLAIFDASYADPTQALIAFMVGILVIGLPLYLLHPSIKFDAKASVILGIAGGFLTTSLGLPRDDLGGQESVYSSLTVAECQQCWAALPWHLAEGHVELGFGCRSAPHLW